MLQQIDYVVPNSDDAQRLFHGRGHCYAGFEHISIDWLKPVVLITLYKEESTSNILALAERLFDAIPDCESVQVQYRYLPRAPFETLLGKEITNLEVEENGCRFHISLGRAQNTGLFLDMANGRQWVKLNVADKNVLNLFSYTCAFSVAALAGNASQVVNIDMSKASLSTGRENHRLNKQDTAKVKFEGVDIFKSFGRIKKHGPYDLLICDPPSFQKGSVDIKRDYKKIIRRIPEFMKPGSDIMLCLNSPDLDDEFLKTTVEQECGDCIFVDSIATPAIFKEAIAGKGLKVQIYRYQPDT